MVKKVVSVQGKAVNQVVDRIDVSPTYRRIARSGNTRYLAVTHQIPDDWKLVDVMASQPDGKVLTLTVRKVD